MVPIQYTFHSKHFWKMTHEPSAGSANEELEALAAQAENDGHQTLRKLSVDLAKSLAQLQVQCLLCPAL